MRDLVIRNASIVMEWDDDGAVISSTLPIHCPRCQVAIAAGVEHRCGNRACEWNPTLGEFALDAPRATDCRNPVTVSLGAGRWHLCGSCSKLPRFKRYKHRVLLPGGSR